MISRWLARRSVIPGSARFSSSPLLLMRWWVSGSVGAAIRGWLSCRSLGRIFFVLLLLASVPVVTAGQPPSFAEAYLGALIEGTEDARHRLPAITRAAEAAAERLLAGGELYMASTRYDFTSEGRARAGGLMLLRQYDSAVNLRVQDVVVVGWSGTSPAKDLALLKRVRASGALTIGMGPTGDGALPQQVDLHLESALALSPVVRKPFGGESYPVISLQNLAVQWAWTGELAAALTRGGYMPVMYQSVLVPGARDRNSRYPGRRFHEKDKIPIVPPGQLGRSYLQALGNCFQQLKQYDSDSIAAVARACVKARRSGHQIYTFLIQHFPYHQLGAPGDPVFMEKIERSGGEIPDPEHVKKSLQRGDVFFFVGYFRRPDVAFRLAKDVGAVSVEVISGTDEPQPDPVPDYVIRPHWPYQDALVSVPNYDIRILPSSGILQAAVYWSVVGSIAVEEGAESSQ